MDKKIAQLTASLSEYGTVQIIKAGVVFSLLITGEGLDNWGTCNEIQMSIVTALEDEYPEIEVMRNDKSFFCVVLKKKS